MTSTSGARFPQTNTRIEGAARDSKHTKGEAHDGFFEGVQISVQSQFAQWIGGGGVGFYPNKNFIHTDAWERFDTGKDKCVDKNCSSGILALIPLGITA